MPAVSKREQVLGFLRKEEDQPEEEVYCLECAIESNLYKEGKYIEPATRLVKESGLVYHEFYCDLCGKRI